MATSKKVARRGDRLRLHYICKDDDGNMLESTLQGPPAEIRLGDGEMLDALEKALFGMAPGQVKVIRLDPEEAFGEYDPDLIDEVEKSELELDCEPEVGMELEFDEDGETYYGIITEINDKTVIIDANHPLAGVILNYELTLLEIL